ncbi:hypothetical protein ACFL34_04685, partial [Candidatus Sumerlaeota bacterium]
CALLVFLVCGCAEVPPVPLNQNQGRNEDLATAILGKWKYLPAISKRRPCDGVWNYLKFRENGTVDYSYNYDGKTYTCTDAYEIQYSGKIDKLRSKYPIIHMWSTKPMASRGSELIGVTLDFDSRIPMKEGKVLKFSDVDGYESVFKRDAKQTMK